ncbi:anti-sigma factor family protein [Pseudomonas japonica]|uniref:anti-sigma factor family protein n=1 Tax=Pseudomonas japonica TaxID=256466 RepID=UPI0015E27B46|nr:anti-sigma factor [Pseudomonas japonica]MBA1243487.1 anti-sigma factor [Pseudomonas japonica]
MMTLPPSENDLNAYVDHQMNAADRQRLEAWLAEHPETQALVSAWQRDAQQLRAAWSGSLHAAANPALDPVTVARRVRGQRARRMAQAAVLVVAVGAGAVGGWQARGPMEVRVAAAPMTDALQAYRMFAVQGILPADYTAEGGTGVQAWLDRYFSQAQRLPDLSAAGFEPRSARLLNTDQGPAAMVVYENATGQRASFYVRPPGPGYHMLPRGSRRDGELQADYWSDPSYNYAMVSAVGLPSRAVLERAVGEGI